MNRVGPRGLVLATALALVVLVGACGDAAEPTNGEAGAAPQRSEEQLARARFFEVYRAAGRAKRGDEIEEALRLYREALDIDPVHEGALVEVVHCLRLLDRPEEAIEVLEELRRLHPELPRPAFLLAEVLAAEDATDENLRRAARLYEEVLGIEPNVIGPRLGLAGVQGRLGLVDEARESYGIVLAGDPENRPALRGLAAVELASGRPAEALPLLVKALEIGTKAQGRIDVPSEMDTAESFEKGRVESGDNRIAWLMLARCARELGGYPESVPARFRHPDPASVTAETR